MKRPGLLAGGVVAGAATLALLASPGARCSGPGLADAAEGSGVTVGVALSWHGLTEDDRYARTLKRDFEAVTLENATKWSTVHHEPGGEPDYQRADALVRFASGSDLAIQGHPLVWDEHVPHWVPTDADPARFQSLHRSFQDRLVERFEGRISTWDVVNEVIEDDGKVSGAPNFARLGPDGLAQAFRRAHAAVPHASLAYNDYSIEWDNARQAGVLRLIDRWLAAGVPIDRVGIQGHMVAGLTPSRDQWRQAIRRFGDRGLKVHLSELDVRSRHLKGAARGRQLAAARAFYDAVSACVDEPACDRVTVWGLTSRWSWMNRHEHREDPVLYDAEHERLPAWYAVEAALARAPWPGCALDLAPPWQAEAGALVSTPAADGAPPTWRHRDRPGPWAGPILDLTDRVSEGLAFTVTAPVRPAQASPVQLTLRVEGDGPDRFVTLARAQVAAGEVTTLQATLDLSALDPPLTSTPKRIVVYLEGPAVGVDLDVQAAGLSPACP